MSFLFIPLTSVTYTSTVIPPIILVAVLSKLEHWLDKKLPEAARPIATPLLCAGIMVPLGNTTDYSSSLMGVVIGIAIAVVVAFVLVQIIGFDDPAKDSEKDAPEKADSPAASGLPFTVCAPLNGTAAALSDVPDETFSTGVLGQGAIIPSDGKLYAPFDGVVSLVADTKHAVSLDGPGGCEMLIHVGLETVSLNGKYFSPKVKDGDKVKKGDLLMEFDLKAISKDFKTITPVLVTNIEDLGEIVPIRTSGPVKAGDPLYEIRS